MDANEQRARELLAAEYAKAYAEPFGAPIDSHAIAVRVIAKALAQQVPADGEVAGVRDTLIVAANNPVSHGGLEGLRKIMRAQAARLAATTQAPQPVVDAPSVADSKAMGAKGGPSNEAERLAFEAWMHGHCWALCATWDGAGYRGDAEQSGRYCPDAARTRGLWAAWRDRAALAASQPQQGAAEPIGWVFQHDETGRQTFCPNDGVNTVVTFLELNPRYALVCPAYTTIGQQAVDDACNCPGGSKPASMHAPNCPVRTTENK